MKAFFVALHAADAASAFVPAVVAVDSAFVPVAAGIVGSSAVEFGSTGETSSAAGLETASGMAATVAVVMVVNAVAWAAVVTAGLDFCSCTASVGCFGTD